MKSMIKYMKYLAKNSLEISTLLEKSRNYNPKKLKIFHRNVKQGKTIKVNDSIFQDPSII